MKYEFDGLAVPGEEWTKDSPKSRLCYTVGALLYTPALNGNVTELIKKNKSVKSLALCLEDAINDRGVMRAEQVLKSSLESIHSGLESGVTQLSDLPLIFVRVRSPKQMNRLMGELGAAAEVLTGLIVPKFDVTCADEYIYTFGQIRSKRKLYLMPIIETESAMDIRTRAKTLSTLYGKISTVSEDVLNIRVGGNDFCRQFGFRRPKNRSIYEIGVVSSALADIMNIFGRDYVVSAPVWEYFAGSDGWRSGLENELELDRLNGFVGKTAIHPSQLEIIQSSHIVELADYEDAKRILNWQDEILAVSNSSRAERMNEVRVHKSWAAKTLSLARIYGVK